ncbi:MAG: helix-turn-helix transcriptional regulator [Gammaproteobacteria bacterium]|nr:helix-turn-helix transcriptional regulator [Gammaproteobacteria bacterium]
MSLSNCPVAQRIKQARQRMGISQRNLGIAAGIDPTSSSARMNQYERGKHVPDFDTLVALARVLTVPVNYFYCIDDAEAEFQLNYHQLRTSQQTQIKQLVQRINFK